MMSWHDHTFCIIGPSRAPHKRPTMQGFGGLFIVALDKNLTAVRPVEWDRRINAGACDIAQIILLNEAPLYKLKFYNNKQQQTKNKQTKHAEGG